MKYFQRWLLIGVFFAAVFPQITCGQSQPGMAEQLLALANQARAQAGAAPLVWDAALAGAAMRHCQRMVVEGALSHRYPGELDLTERASAAGAHFSVIEENIAMGQYPDQIHEDWMRSQGHRENLMSREVNRVGIAVIAHGGNIYAVADYAQGVASLTPEQAEAQVAALVGMSGIKVRSDVRDARRACAMERGLPEKLSDGDTPTYVMRWQGADLGHLPQPLVDRLGSGQYHQAAIGSCEPRNADSGFTMYRFAVLLY